MVGVVLYIEPGNLGEITIMHVQLWTVQSVIITQFILFTNNREFCTI